MKGIYPRLLNNIIFMRQKHIKQINYDLMIYLLIDQIEDQILANPLTTGNIFKGKLFYGQRHVYVGPNRLIFTVCAQIQNHFHDRVQQAVFSGSDQ